MTKFRYTLDYKLLLLSTVLSGSIGGLLYPVLSIYALKISNSYLYPGLIFATPLVATAAMSVGWGMLSDKLGQRKKIIIFTTFVASIFYFLFPFLSVAQLVLARTIQAVFAASSILITVLATEYFSHRKGTSVGDLYLFAGVGSAVGGALSGFVLSYELQFASASTFWLFYSCGIVSLFSLIPLVYISETKKSVKTFTPFVRGVLRSRRILLLCCIGFFVACSGFLIFAIFPAYLKYNLGAAPAVIGTFMAVSSCTGIMGSGVAGRFCDTFGRKSMLLAAVFAYILIWLGYAFTKDIIVLGVLWAIPVWSFFIISVIAMTADLTSNEQRGSGLGLLISVTIGIGGFAGSLLAGLLADKFGFQFIALLSVLFGCTGFVLALRTRETLNSSFA